ncbi:hypothetical protein KR009_004783 [Drosophila setifemur]|nr:hypothetical protein KR009_004783 [Drosophila setifemur]
MDKMGEQSYQDFFDTLRGSAGPRNLHQIFEDDSRPLQHETRSLRYQPPSSSSQTPTAHKSRPEKQEKMHISSSDSEASGDWQTLIAKVVHAFQGSENLGKVGLALSILGHNEASKLILYKSKRQVMATLSMQRGLGHGVFQRENYWQFYDDDRRFWSLRFEQPADEDEFTHIMTKYELPMEQFGSRVASPSGTLTGHRGDSKEEEHPAECSCGDTYCHRLSEESHEQEGRNYQHSKDRRSPEGKHSSSSGHKQSKEDKYGSRSSDSKLRRSQKHQKEQEEEQPKPLPRARDRKQEKESQRESYQYRDREQERDRDQSPLQEDVIVTPLPRPIGTITHLDPTQFALVTSESQLPAKYRMEQRANDRAMDGKLDTLLMAIKRLEVEAGGGARAGAGTGAGAGIGLGARAGARAGSGLGALAGAASIQDNEDELLELEQKLLDFKRENRALIRSLQAREQALEELRNSTCALCEELLEQNSNLKKQNAMLLAALASKCAEIDGVDSSGEGCKHCRQANARIETLQGHVLTLKDALRFNSELKDPVSNRK